MKAGLKKHLRELLKMRKTQLAELEKLQLPLRDNIALLRKVIAEQDSVEHYIKHSEYVEKFHNEVFKPYNSYVISNFFLRCRETAKKKNEVAHLSDPAAGETHSNVKITPLNALVKGEKK